MAEDYKLNPHKYNLFTFEEYKDFIISFLERLNPNIVIERFVSEVPPRYNVLSAWSNLRNEEIVSEIEQEMIKRNTFQGRLFNHNK